MMKKAKSKSQQLTDMIDAKHRRTKVDDYMDEDDGAPILDDNQGEDYGFSSIKRGGKKAQPLRMKGTLDAGLSTGKYATREAPFDNDDDDDFVAADPDEPFDPNAVEDNLDDLFGMLDDEPRKKKKSTQKQKQATKRQRGDDDDIDKDLAAQIAELQQMQSQQQISVTDAMDEPSGPKSADTQRWNLLVSMYLRMHQCVAGTNKLLCCETSEITAVKSQIGQSFTTFLETKLPTVKVGDGKEVEKQLQALRDLVKGAYESQGLDMPTFDPSYWQQRSQKNRSRLVIGKTIKDYDPKLFNDDDLYTHLAMQVSRESLLQGKVSDISTARRTVVTDRRRSKGRKLQFEAHPKLVGFKQRPLTIPSPSTEILNS
eukprot:PhF_6_TR40058/c0_g1_i1/m.59430